MEALRLIKINEDLIQGVEKYIKNKSIDYPSIKNFVEKSIREKLESGQTKNTKRGTNLKDN